MGNGTITGSVKIKCMQIKNGNENRGHSEQWKENEVTAGDYGYTRKKNWQCEKYRKNLFIENKKQKN